MNNVITAIAGLNCWASYATDAINELAGDQSNKINQCASLCYGTWHTSFNGCVATLPIKNGVNGKESLFVTVVK